jgi:hypothetical protein
MFTQDVNRSVVLFKLGEVMVLLFRFCEVGAQEMREEMEGVLW